MNAHSGAARPRWGGRPILSQTKVISLKNKILFLWFSEMSLFLLPHEHVEDASDGESVVAALRLRACVRVAAR